MNYVIIGNSAAAVGAVEGIRQVDRDGRITLISDEPYHTYSRPLISYWLAGKVNEKKMIYRDLGFYEANAVTPVLGVRAEKVDPAAQRVELADGTVVPYDKLLIATGGKPIVPQIEGLAKEGVFTFLKLDDVKGINQHVLAGKKKAVVIGAGLIGLKAVEGLAKAGVDVTVVELANRILPAILDEQAGEMVQKYLADQGIQFALSNTVTKVLGEDQVTGVALQNGSEIECDMLIVAIGVQPNVDLVRDSEVQINRGILVNEKMETSAAGIYAAGDVAEGFDLVYGIKRVLPLLPNAYQQGETAGLNMAGRAAVFAGGFAMNAIGFGDLPMITAGIIKPDADNFEVMVTTDPETSTYRKVVLQNNRLVGFICLNRIDRAGILTGLIKGKVDVSVFKDRLIDHDFGYVDFPEEYRKSRLLSGEGA